MPELTAVALAEAQDPLILSLDLGSSSVRAGLFDGLGRSVAGLSSKLVYRLHVDDDGAAVADPLELLDRLGQAIDAVLAAAGDAGKRLAAVASCSLVSNVMGIGLDGAPTTPLYTWADTRPAPDVAALRGRVDEAAWHERVGAVIHTSYLPPRFLWLQRTQPALLRQTHQWLSLGEFIHLRLFGKRACSYSVASWTGMLNRHTLDWDAETLSLLPISAAQLAPLTDYSAPMEGLTGDYAQRWPALAAIPWFLTVGDGAAANIGSGCATPDRVALTIGTSGAMRVVVPGVRQMPHGLWSYRVDSAHALLGGAISNGGLLFDWLRRTINLSAIPTLEAQLAAMPPDSHGLTVLPFLAGERSPGWATNARATISGLSVGSTPLDIVRAGLEAVAYRLTLIYRGLSEQVSNVADVYASGGAMLASPTWTQIIADALGVPITICTEPEATSRGNVLLALSALGLPANHPAATGPTYQPDPANHAIYQEAIARQQQLYGQIVGAG